MRWQRKNLLNEDETPEEQLSQVETGDLPYRELKVMIVDMFKELWWRMDA